MDIARRRLDYWTWRRRNCDTCQHAARRGEAPRCAIQQSIVRAMSPLGDGFVDQLTASEAGIRNAYPWSDCSAYRRRKSEGSPEEDKVIHYVGH